MNSIVQDLRFGFRLLHRQPGFALAAALVLAVGIGVNTAAFSLVNALLLKPRIGGIDHELAGVYSREIDRPDSYRAFSWADYAALRERTDLFRSLAAHGFGLAGLREGDHTRRVFADIVTANYFETFGVAPQLGRGFTAEEERPGADIPVVVVSDGVWKRLGGSPDVLGTQVQINLRAFTVVGIAPAGFGGSMVLATPEIWVPTGMYETMAFDLRNEALNVSLSDPELRQLILVARLPSGATIASRAAPLDAATRHLAESNPAANGDQALQLAPLSRLSVSTRPQVDDELTGVATAMLSLAAVVLLIASFNLANMLLARGQARRKELAIRLAIGGGRWRLVRQLLTESALLASIGGAGGIVLAWWGTRFVFASMPAVLPFSLAFDPTPDARVLTAAVAFSMAAAVTFGLGPAWKLARTQPLPELKEQAGEIGPGRAWLRWLTTRDALVMGQLALTFVMLTVAGLFVRGAFEAARSDPGFTLDRGVIVNIDTSFGGYSADRSRAYFAEAIRALRTVPGVEVAGFASHMPFGEIQTSTAVQLPGPIIRQGDASATGRLEEATTASISSGYFDAMDIPVLLGRDFTEAEAFSMGGERIAVIDVELARRLFGDENPVDRQIQIAEGDEPVVMRVVGVVGGVRPDLFSEGPEPFLYSTFGQSFQGNLYLHARTSAATPEAEAALLPAIGRTLGAIDPELPFVALETRPMFRARNLPLALLNTGASLFAMFGLAALFLAAIGVYGVKAYLVSRRTREIGIRVALGAEPRNVISMVLREGLTLVAAGLLLGVGLSVLAGGALRGMLFQGQALDLPVIALAAGTLVLAVLLASWIPARRATRVAPTTALRAS
jgi:predicted permease